MLFPHRLAPSQKGSATRRLRLEALEDRQLLSVGPAVIDLATLDGTNGIRLDGIDVGDQSGHSVSSAGDINGDGFDDMIIGARGAAPGGLTYAGETYVVFGRSVWFTSSIDLSTLDGTTGFRLDGMDMNNEFGWSVNSAGDVNGDSFDDLIIGTRQNSLDSVREAGETYVVFGHSGGFSSSLDLSTLDGANGFRLDGLDADDLSGFSVKSAGDVNGDGFDDMIIGAYAADPDGKLSAGETYVVFGHSGEFSSAFDLSTLNGINGFRIDGIDQSDQSGYSVSSAGDVNGDGLDDIIIGATGADPNGDDEAGETYVVFGQSGGYSSSINLSTLSGSNGFRLDGIDAEDQSGYSVSSAGDINGDGFDDMIIGAYAADPGGKLYAGETYVVFGHSDGYSWSLDLSTLNGTNGFRLDGINAYDQSGCSVSSAGDINGDGFDDIIIGAKRATPGGLTYAGETYVVFGHSGGFSSALDLSTLDGANGFRLPGIDGRDQSGCSVSSAGDVNGDGFDDMIIGANEADPNGGGSGETYVVFGGNFTGGAETQVGDNGPNMLIANQGAAATDILIGGQNDDLLFGDGGPDVLRGGEGDDTLTVPAADFQRLIGGNGFDTLRLAGAGITLDLTSIPDNRIIDVEQIDITGTGGNMLTLDVQEVLNISTHSNTLIVKRDVGDVVNLGSGWTQQTGELIGGDYFEVFTQGAAVLKVETDNDVYLEGTTGDDTVRVWPGTPGGAQHCVQINGVDSYYNAGVYDAIHVDGLGGTDTINVYGKAIAENAAFNGTSVHVSETSVYDVYGQGFENSYVYGGGGADTAQILGSGGNDNFYSHETYTYLRGDSNAFLNYVKDFDTVFVDMTVKAGGTDNAYMHDSSGDDILVAGETQATLDYDSGVTPGVDITAVGFDRVDTYAQNGGSDTATLTGSTGVDTFTGLEAYSYVTGNSGAFLNYVKGFGNVKADVSGDTETDVAILYDSSGNDRLDAGETESSIDYNETPGINDLNIIVRGFDQTYAYATSGGTDDATLSGSSGDDTFTGLETYAHLAGNSGAFLNYVKGFDNVKADVYGTGGTDTANLFDSAGDDRLDAGETHVVMDFAVTHGVSDPNLTATGFPTVNVYALQGGNDAAFMTGSTGNDRFMGRVTYGRMKGNDGAFINYAKGFDTVTAGVIDSAGIDIAVIYDSEGNDHLVAGAMDASIDYGATPGVSNPDVIARGFDQTYTYATSGGDDTATLTGSTGNDRFTVKQTSANMKGPTNTFFNYATGFDQLIGNASSGGTDKAFLYDSATNDLLTANPTQATLDYDATVSPGVDVTAQDFDEVYVYSQNGGTDMAVLTGSAGVDRFTAQVASSYLKANDNSYYNYVNGFDAVTANAVGSGDLAFMYDSDGNDILNANSMSAAFTLSPTVGTPVVNTALAFDQVYSYASGGGTDKAYLDGTTGADTFTGDLDWGYLRSIGTGDYFNYVRYFDEVFADPGDTDIGNDLLDNRGATYALDTTPGNGNVW